MPSNDHPGGQPAPGRQPPSQPKRAVIVVQDGGAIPGALDIAEAHVRRKRNLQAVRVERDNRRGEGFARAVDQRRRGEVETVILPSPDHLPPWIEFAERDPRT